MKTRCLFLFVAPWLCLTSILGQASADPQSIKAEFDASKREGLERLGGGYISRLEAIQQAHMQTGSLDRANAIQKEIDRIKALAPPGGEYSEELPPDALPLVREHDARAADGVRILAQNAIAQLEQMKLGLLRSGDLDGANTADSVMAELKLAIAPPEEKAEHERKQPLKIAGYVDGNTELRLGRDGFYWLSKGGAAKVGLHEGANEPTYVNGRQWTPKWRLPLERGSDSTDLYPHPSEAPRLKLKSWSASRQRGGPHEENRTPVKAYILKDEFVVEIRDPQGGARWYELVLVPDTAP